ncbi:MAG: class C sortase, partial [Promicromonosporaceae bacterium]|nr:class C sortase [Promicromonosporaceae bacterium]
MNRLIALVLGAAVCFGVVEYSPMRHWLSDFEHRQEMIAYAEMMRNAGDEPLTAVGERAHEYNERLLAGTLDMSGQHADQYYLNQLKVGSSKSIGHISYEALGIHVPLRLGTDDDVLAQGAGHLYGTALPVGGEGIRPVLSAHSGMVESKMFTPLLKAEIGQVFTVTTAVGTLWYEVSEIRTVEPWEIEEIEAVPGEDLVTLMTCTPIGINTHRLLVTGHRIDGPLHPDPQILSFWAWPGLPWPLFWWLFAVAVTAGVGKYFYVTKPAKRAAALAAG